MKNIDPLLVCMNIAFGILTIILLLAIFKSPHAVLTKDSIVFVNKFTPPQDDTGILLKGYKLVESDTSFIKRNNDSSIIITSYYKAN